LTTARGPATIRQDALMSPIAQGSLLAVTAAVLFGLTAPLVQRFGVAADPFSTALLLYAGAAFATLGAGRRGHAREAPVGRAQAPRLAAIAVVGGAVAPACFAWGLQRTNGSTGSLLLNFEAVFTALLAWLFYREHLGGRFLLALGTMSAAGVLLAWTGAGAADAGHAASRWGATAVVAATLAWALDNTLTRPLADRDPVQVVRFKGILGALASLGGALVLGPRWPTVPRALALLACGATGYGVSLRLYLLAQRRIGAARTGSVFALAPFLGAAVAWALGERGDAGITLTAGALFGVAVYLHVTERHDHLHVHAPLAHEHAHRHDDGHHDHRHDPAVEGEHSHFHRHDERVHAHPHGADVHHGHGHR
jgi:drug/metabolite transporter (DMT)-like permease